MLTKRQIQIIRKSWEVVLPTADKVGALFYRKLFKLAPGVRELFPKDVDPQGTKLMAMLDVVVKNLDSLEDIISDVQDLGVRHDAYGAAAEHYPVVGKALLATLKQGLKSKWTKELEKAWTDAFEIVSSVMIEAQEKAEEEEQEYEEEQEQQEALTETKSNPKSKSMKKGDKDLEKQVKLLEARLASNVELLEKNVDAVITIDGETKNVEFWNAAAERIWGWTKEEAIGRNIKNFVPDEVNTLHDSYVDADLTTSVNKIVGIAREVEVQRKDGTRVPVLLTMNKVLIGGKTKFTSFVKDISKQKEAENEATKEKEINEAILMEAADSVITIDGAKTVTFWNKKAEEMWGYKAEETLGQNIKNFVPDEVKAPHEGYVDANIQTGVNKIVGIGREIEVQRKDGSRVPVLLTMSKAEVDGEVRFTSFVKDLTEQKRLEQVAENESKINKAILMEAADAVITIDGAKTVTFWNKKAEEMWGYTAEETLGKNIKNFVPDGVTAPHEGYVDANIQTEVNMIVGTGREVEVQRKDGSRVPVMLTMSKAEVGGEVRFTLFVKDLTEQKRLEAQAEREKKINEAILMEAADAVITIDGAKTVTFWNKKAEEMWGYKAEETLGQNIKNFVPDEVKAPHEGYVDANIQTGVNKIVGTGREIEVQRKDGSRVPVLLTMSKAEVDGEVRFTSFVKDLTEQKRLEALAERERKINYAILMDAADAVITTDGDKMVTFWNKKAAEKWGYKAEETIGRNIKNFVPDEVKMPHDAYVDANITTGVNKIVGTEREVEVQRKDGSRVSLMLTMSKAEVDGEIRFTSFVKDLTEQKRLEALAERERKIYEAILMEAPDAVVTINREKTITFWNKKAEEMWGYMASETLGKNIKNFVPDEVKAPHAGYVDANIQTGVNKIVGTGREIEVQRKDGSRVPVMLTMSKAEVDGEVRFTSFVKDLSQQKKIEMEAQNEKDLNDKILMACPDAVVSIDQTRTVVFWNKKAEEMWGYTAEETIGNNIKNYVPDEIKAPYDGYVDANMNTGTNKIVGTGREIEVQRKDGKRVPVLLTMSKAEAGGNTRFTAFVKDIAQQKEQERQIQENVKNLEIAQEEIQRVVQVVSEEGKLSERVDLELAKGGTEELMRAINGLLEGIADPINSVTETIVALSEGNLTQQVDIDAKGDLKDMADAMNLALNNLNDLLGGVNNNALEVGTSSQQMVSQSDDMNKNTLDVASAVQQMAEGAQSQAKKTDEASRVLEGMKKSTEQMIDQVASVNKAAATGEENAKEGKEIMDGLVLNIDEIAESANVTANSIDILKKRSEEITKTLSVITDIARQTNLLALNAAIEAAKAGEAGRGFAVVAEEIRKLAEGSKKSVDDINNLVDDVQNDTEAAAKAIEQMASSVDTGKDASGQAAKSFESISVLTRQTLEQSNSIKEITDEQKISVDQIAKSIEEVVVVSEQTASGAQHVAGTSQQLTAAIEEFAASSKRLNDISEDLIQGVSTFDLAESSEAERKEREREAARAEASAPKRTERRESVNLAKAKAKKSKLEGKSELAKARLQ